MRRISIGLAVAAALLLTGCSKAAEPFKDAHVDGRNDDPARIGTMPDGFNNFAYKCVGTDMVYTLFHSDSGYGSIAVSPNSPACGGTGVSTTP